MSEKFIVLGRRSEVGYYFNGIQFSSFSPLYAPKLKEIGEGGGVKRLCTWDKFHVVPPATLQLMQHLAEYPDLSSVQTRWGQGTIDIDPSENHINVELDVQRVADNPQERLQLTMDASFDPLYQPFSAESVPNGHATYTLGAELAYISGGRFAVRQFAQFAMSNDGRFGIVATAIAFGLEALERTR